MGAGMESSSSTTLPNILALRELHAELEDSFKCPITLNYMIDPVIAADGHTYERHAIERWFGDGHGTSPKTGAPLVHTNTVRNHALRNAIEEYVKTVPREDRPVPVAERSEPVANP